DSLDVHQVLFPVGSPFTPGTRLDIQDSFSARNDFHGAEIGIRTELQFQPWSAEFLTKVAVGRLHRDVTISGQTHTVVPGSAATDASGGLLALASNIGSHSSNDWELAPEI